MNADLCGRVGCLRLEHKDEQVSFICNMLPAAGLMLARADTTCCWLLCSCLSSACRDERIYFGREIRNNVVRVGAGDKWQDLDYLNHTSLKTYMPYMMGGGYVVSSDLAQVRGGAFRSPAQHKGVPPLLLDHHPAV